MFEDLLPAMEKSIMDAAGSIPVVLKGIERTFEKGSSLPSLSRHDWHELTFMRSGRAEFEIDSRKIMLEKGATLVIRPRMPHTIRVLDGHADMIVLYFSFSKQFSANTDTHAGETDRSSSTQTRLPDDNMARWHKQTMGRSALIAPQTLEQFINFASGNEKGDDGRIQEPFLIIRGKSRQEIAALVERILRENRLEAYGQQLMMQLLAMELLVALARGLREEWEESLRVRTGKARELVRIARDYIVENHDRDISVAEAAAYVFLSQGYFTRAFRDETGMSPMAFLMQVRVDHACKLLVQKDIKVSGVASQVGFSSPQRFNAAFRKHIGMTPMQYRRQVLVK